jgi:thiamine-monophosphate kinase
MISERECIKIIQDYAARQNSEYLVKGIGDDCAVIKKDESTHLLFTTDTLVEGVHFNLNWHSPYLLGRKCAAVNLSDIAAMGGQPKVCLLSVAFPQGVPSWFENFMSGFSGLLQDYDTLLVGGDTVKGFHGIVISVTIIGEADKKHICYRTGAEAGDMIWVTGPLGNAAAGLYLCQKSLDKPGGPEGEMQQLVKAHLDPEPLVGLGTVLAKSGLVKAMMDISDGLATDLAHLCSESGVGAEVKQEFLPVSQALKQVAAAKQIEPVDWILRGGEDYQLLFTAEPSGEQKLRQLTADHVGREIFIIGRIVAGKGVYLCDKDKRREISYQGYDHFQN